MRSPSIPALPAGVSQAAVAIICGLALALLIPRLSIFLVAGGMAAVAYFVLFLQRPDLGLLIALIVRSSTDLSYRLMGGALVHPGLGSLPNTGLVLIVIAAGSLVILSRNAPFLRLPGGAPFTLLLLAGFIGMLRADSILLSFSEWLPVVCGFVVYALAAHLFGTPPRSQAVVVALGASFTLPALVGFYQFLSGQGLFDPHVGMRVTGSFVHPNAFGVYLVVIFAVFLGEAVMHTGRRRWIALLVLAVTGPLFLGTLTRVAWAGALVALLVVGVLRSRLVLVSIPILLIGMIAAVPTIGSRLADPLGGSFADRVDIWRGLAAQWLQVTGADGGPITAAISRLMGLGPGVVGALTAPGRGGIGFAAHNDYLRVLVEYGVFGLGAFLILHIILLTFAYRAWGQTREGPFGAITLSFVALAVAYPVMSITENVFAATQNQMYFWTIAGLAVGAVRRTAPVESAEPSWFPSRMGEPPLKA